MDRRSTDPGAAWLAALRTEPADSGPFDAVRGQLLYRILLFVAPVAWGVSLLQLALPDARALAVYPLLFAVWVTGCVPVARAGRHRAAAIGLVYGTTALLCAMFVPLGGIGSGTPSYFVASAMLAVILLDRWLAAAAVALQVGALLAAPAIARWASLTPPDFPWWGPLLTRSVALVEIVCLGGFAVDAFLRVRREAETRTVQSLTAAEQARGAVEAKARFLATMSHELRTPLNAIIGYTELLREETPNDADLARIEVTGRGLLALVEDVLELARAESAVVRPESVDLRGLIRAELGVHGYRGPVQLGDELVVTTDRRALARIVRVLVTEAGEHLVSVSGRSDGDQILLVVEDRRARAEGALQRLLLPFAEQEPGTTGLALPLCDRLVRQLGGSLTIEGTAAAGATFVVALPRSR